MSYNNEQVAVGVRDKIVIYSLATCKSVKILTGHEDTVSFKIILFHFIYKV